MRTWPIMILHARINFIHTRVEFVFFNAADPGHVKLMRHTQPNMWDAITRILQQLPPCSLGTTNNVKLVTERNVATPWFRRLVAGLSSRKSWDGTGGVSGARLTLEQNYLQILRVSLTHYHSTSGLFHLSPTLDEYNLSN
jgi:hypothetical protein